MAKLIDDMSPRDIDQWLGGGWAFVPNENNDVVPAQYEGMISTRSLAFRTDGDTFFVSPNNVRCHWPLGGAINIPVTGLPSVAGFLIRLQVRQYRRTYYSGGYSLYIPRLWDVARLSPHYTELSTASYDVIKAAFRPHYPCFTAALLHPSGSVALDRNTILYKEQDFYYVYASTGLIGRLIGRRLVPFAGGTKACARLAKQYSLDIGGQP